MRDIFGDVFGPALSGVEGNDADWGAALAAKQILDDVFQIGSFEIGLAPSAAMLSEILRHEVNGLIVTVEND